MNIAILIEGDTEKSFLPVLRNFLDTDSRPKGRMPRFIPIVHKGRIPKNEKLKREVETLLTGRTPDAEHVIALTDVYTVTNDFQDARDAREKMRDWVGPEPRFHPHAAQYDFEAWLLPYWPAILQLAKHNLKAPSGKPESVNHNRPPSVRIKEVFKTGKGRDYNRPRDARKILEANDLSIAVQCCPELKAFINTILTLCGGDPL